MPLLFLCLERCRGLRVIEACRVAFGTFFHGELPAASVPFYPGWGRCFGLYRVIARPRLLRFDSPMPELTAPTRQQKITIGEMRSSGVRGLLIYCSDYHCSHSTAISGDRWPGHIRLSDLEPLFVCQACGRRGADIRPDWDWELSRRRASGLSWLETSFR